MIAATKLWKAWLALASIAFLLALVLPKGSVMFGGNSSWFTSVGVLLIGTCVLVPLLLIALIATVAQMAVKRRQERESFQTDKERRLRSIPE